MGPHRPARARPWSRPSRPETACPWPWQNQKMRSQRPRNATLWGFPDHPSRPCPGGSTEAGFPRQSPVPFLTSCWSLVLAASQTAVAILREGQAAGTLKLAPKSETGWTGSRRIFNPRPPVPKNFRARCQRPVANPSWRQAVARGRQLVVSEQDCTDIIANHWSRLCGIAGLLEHCWEVRLRGLQAIMVRPSCSSP